MSPSTHILRGETRRPNSPVAPPAPAPGWASQENSNLDFLRSFAVLRVFLGHLSFFHQFLALGPLNLCLMGALGVTFFFVHTALFLMLSLERQQKDQGDTRLFMSFMIRPSFRFSPLSLPALPFLVPFPLPLPLSP